MGRCSEINEERIKFITWGKVKAIKSERSGTPAQLSCVSQRKGKVLTLMSPCDEVPDLKRVIEGNRLSKAEGQPRVSKGKENWKRESQVVILARSSQAANHRVVNQNACCPSLRATH